MKDPLFYIQSSCRIRNRAVWVNGEERFSCGTGSNTTDGEFLKEIYRHLGLDYPKFYKMDLLCKAVFLAAEWIEKEAPFSGTSTALVFSNASSSYISDEKHASGLYKTVPPSASPAVFVYTLPNIAAGELSIRHQLYSEQVFFTFEQFSPDKMVPYQEGILQQGRAEKVLGGWVEAGVNGCDIFLYLIAREGGQKHTAGDLLKLYNQEL